MIVSEARNELIPKRLAYYVPRIKGKPILPIGWKPPVEYEAMELQEIIPADLPSKFFENNSPIASNITRKAMLDQEENKVLKELLLTIDEITFKKPARKETPDQMMGFVTSKDIADSMNALFSQESTQFRKLDRLEILIPTENKKFTLFGTFQVQIALNGWKEEPFPLRIRIEKLKSETKPTEPALENS